MIGKAGLVYVPINWRLTGQEAAYIINESGAKVLFVDQEHVDVFRSIKNDIPGVKHIICINGSPEDMINYDDFIAPASPEDPGVDVEETDVLGLVYTSGTSALPKGVVYTHQKTIEIGRLQVREPNYRNDDTFLGVLPLFHVAMLNVQFSKYNIGMTQYIMRFEPKAVMETIQKYKITAFQAVPIMVITMTEHPDRPKYDLSSLRILIYVGSAMPAEAAKRAWKAFGPVLYQVYGATEGGGTILKAEDHAKALSDPSKEYILKSAGKPILGCVLKILDDSGNEVLSGTMGEICFRTKTSVEKYWKKPEEVQECAVIGVPSEKWGEEVKAIIVPRQGMTVTPEEIVEYCQDKMAGYKRPKSAEVWEELPKNPSGKILKREMRQKYWAER
jgi:acyl-CoA synthetase (AMP-forming)/AMP-acid ligase II